MFFDGKGMHKQLLLLEEDILIKQSELIYWFLPNIKNPEPKARNIILPTRRIVEIAWGIPFHEIHSTILLKLCIFSGMAEINIAEIDTLENNLKKIWYFYF